KRAAPKSRPSCESPAFAGITLCSPDGLLGLLQLDGSAGVLDLLLDLLRLILVDAFLDGLGRAFDQRLGFAQTQAGDRADFLDHVDLLAAVAGQDHVELGLLFSRSRGSSAAAGGRTGNRDRSRGRDAPLLFERLGEVSGLKDGQFGKLVDQLGDVSHLILLGGPLARLSCVDEKRLAYAASLAA